MLCGFGSLPFLVAAMSTRTRRWPLIAGGILIAVLITGFALFQFSIQALKNKVEQALGPYGEVQDIRVSLTGVEVIGIRIRAPGDASKSSNWPAEDQLRAERILIVPALRDLLTANVVLRSIRVEGAYLSMLRAKDGRMHVLPSLLEKAAVADEKTGAPRVSIGRVELADSVVEFFDATVRQPPLKIRLEQINASIDKILLPELTGQSRISLVGVLKGVQHDGKISISGPIELASKESEITTNLRGVDLVALQPYLIKAAETGVRRGTLDLDLRSTVRKGVLHAPGTLSLSGLELASSGSGTFMGMPRSAVVSMMKDNSGKITTKFSLDGNINDPKFSLNENLMARVGSSMAGLLGVSIEGLAKGVGSAGSGIAKGLGESVGKLFGK
jgi:hypothetical protein